MGLWVGSGGLAAGFYIAPFGFDITRVKSLCSAVEQHEFEPRRIIYTQHTQKKNEAEITLTGHIEEIMLLQFFVMRWQRNNTQ